ncbi:MAG TPA: YlmC/YmxH family sporulation protein [Bacillota bacterium]|jgi:YlmC/YmxH family sporulation protein
MMKSDLRVREVINIADGRKLGGLVDIEVDLESGRVTALVVPGRGRVLGLFGGDDDCVIPWEKVVKIGVDVILVDLPAQAGAGRSPRLR